MQIKDVQHEEVWEIPKVALREAIINAIIHTDYSLRGAPIRVAIYDDRIEIENNAILSWGLSVEDLQSGVSKLKNPVIARVFHELGLIEQWGSGIKRMMQVCAEAGLAPPVFQEIGMRFRVTFYKEQVKPLQLDKVEEEIISFIREKGALSPKEIIDLMDIKRRTLIVRLANLVDKGVLIELATSGTDPNKKYGIR